MAVSFPVIAEFLGGSAGVDAGIGAADAGFGAATVAGAAGGYGTGGLLAGGLSTAAEGGIGASLAGGLSYGAAGLEGMDAISAAGAIGAGGGVPGAAGGTSIPTTAAGNADVAGTQAASLYGDAASPYTSTGLYGSGTADASGSGSSLMDHLSTMFGGKGAGMNTAKILASVYGLLQSSKLSKLATQPNAAGEQAVQRSMAAQGYQGSGNMMGALNQYGINGSQAAANAGMGPLVGSMSSLGLLTSGAGGLLSGWGG